MKEYHPMTRGKYLILVSNILHHKNLVTFRDYAFHHEELLVAHEYLSNGTLAAYLECEIQHNKCTLPLLTRMEIAIDIANALSYLHKHGIIHHNINSSNILLDKNMCAKVAGLHLSRKLPEDVSVNATSIVSISSDIAKTCVYIDPEYVCLMAESARRMMFIASE
ncbi:calmodulin-binding receptor-like cytoplasmic kinase 2 [Arachis hypogaea]|uniref:calmodulin-binding receptor-like cytoplasmic kinase 2 n=1 Tax=Arachis hypogaea TaxID=3818 RepID=UPI003B224EEE